MKGELEVMKYVCNWTRSSFGKNKEGTFIITWHNTKRVNNSLRQYKTSTNFKLYRASTHSFRRTCSPFGIQILKLIFVSYPTYLVQLVRIYPLLARVFRHLVVTHTRVFYMYVKKKSCEAIALLQSFNHMFSKVLVTDSLLTNDT